MRFIARAISRQSRPEHTVSRRCSLCPMRCRHRRVAARSPLAPFGVSSVSPRRVLDDFIGRKHPMKRLDLTIESFALVAQRLPSAHLAIVGPDGGVEAELRRPLIDRLGIADQVHLIGLLEGERLGTVYSAANLLVMLSQRENFGMAAAEALAFGVPVLLSEDVGLAIEVAAAGAGRVVRPNIDENSTCVAEYAYCRQSC